MTFFSKKNTAVFLYQNQLITAQEFRANIYNLAVKVSKSPKKDWVIYSENKFLFAIGFFALLLAKKNITLPYNIQPKTLESLKEYEILNDITFIKNIVLEKDFEIPHDSQITFFTSGSTGDSRKIHKRFSNLSQEVLAISKMWKNSSEIFVSSVSHQHIYGLLFCVLLPLFRGILIDSSIISSVEQLGEKKFKKITLISSPAFLKRLDHFNFSNLEFEYVFSSGGLLNKYDSRKTEEIFKTSPIEILGSTETGGIAWRNQKNEQFWTKFLEVKIKQNDKNLLLIKSPFTGQDDFVETNDCAEIIDQNHFFLKGRSDRIVKIEEKRVSLDEVELRLAEHNFIKISHATLLLNKRQIIGVIINLSEDGEAFLAKNGKAKLSLLLKKHLLQYFEPITVPRKWRFVDEFPINSQGKLIFHEIQKYFL